MQITPKTRFFEGYINAVVYEVGGVIFRRSLDAMANRVNVTYYNADSPAAQKTEITATVDNTVSQAIYGIKTTNLDAGVHYDNADKTHKTALRDVIINNLSYPQISAASRIGGGVMVSLEIKGLFHFAWGWEIYQNAANVLYPAWASFVDKATGGSRSSNVEYVALVFPDTGWDVLQNSNNTSWGMSQNSKTGQTFLQWLQSILEAGDGTNEWVYGITHRQQGVTLPGRYVYYRAANTNIVYHTKALGKPGEIQDVYGRTIPAWKVRPDNGIRVTDVLANFENVIGDDPRTSYIKFVEYEADSQSVSWQSSDDATLENSLGLRGYFKAHGERFGAGVRPLV